MNSFDRGERPVQLRLGRSALHALAVSAAAVVLMTTGCAAQPGPTRELRDARVALAEARSAAGARAAGSELREADAALAYAEFEERETPGHPLSRHRARA